MDVVDRNLVAREALPASLVACSSGLGWRTMLARVYRDPAEVEEFSTAASPDLLVVTVLRGRYAIEARAGARWRRAEYRRGSVGATAPENVSVLRWRARTAEPMESLHVHLAHELLDETADALTTAGAGAGGSALPAAAARGNASPTAATGGNGLSTAAAAAAAAAMPAPAPVPTAGPRAGTKRLKRRAEELPDALLMSDPLVTSAAFAIADAVRRGAPALYADSIAQMLATHLVYRAGLDVLGERTGRGAALGDGAMRKVIAYMHEHLDSEISLDDLARQVNVSKFHFLRMFAATTGLTPYRYLRRLRLRHAADLLRPGHLTVLQVALACGYRSAGQFAGAFRREYGSAPSEYRRAVAGR